MIATARVSRVSSRTAATAALLAAYCFSATAFAASGSVATCSELDGSRKDLTVAVETLSIDVVEHIPAEPESKLAKPLDLDDAGLQTAAPVLSLSPRVAAILDRIFSVDEIARQPAETERSKLRSPVADGQPGEPVMRDTRELTADDEFQRPKKQQRMYRRDI